MSFARPVSRSPWFRVILSDKILMSQFAGMRHLLASKFQNEGSYVFFAIPVSKLVCHFSKVSPIFCTYFKKLRRLWSLNFLSFWNVEMRQMPHSRELGHIICYWPTKEQKLVLCVCFTVTRIIENWVRKLSGVCEGVFFFPDFALLRVSFFNLEKAVLKDDQQLWINHVVFLKTKSHINEMLLGLFLPIFITRRKRNVNSI